MLCHGCVIQNCRLRGMCALLLVCEEHKLFCGRCSTVTLRDNVYHSYVFVHVFVFDASFCLCNITSTHDSFLGCNIYDSRLICKCACVTSVWKFVVIP